MSDNPPSLDQWQSLYDRAIQLEKMAPWDWMEEGDTFGVQSPEDGTLDFVSVMGMAGEHFAVAVYRGAQAMRDFMSLHANPPDDLHERGERLLSIPQLQLSFEDRDALEDTDHQLIVELDLRFRGSNAWPLFRAYHPGYFPWPIDAEEARILDRSLDHLLEVAPRFERDPALLHPALPDTFLMRVCEEGVWQDRYLPLPPPVADDPPALDPFTLSRFKDLPPTSQNIEVDLFRLWSPVQDGEDHPYYPYILVLVDASTGEMIHFDMLTPKPTLEEMRRSVPLRLLEQFEQGNFLPRQVRVRNARLFSSLQSIASELPFTLELFPSLPILDQLHSQLIQAVDSGFDPTLIPVDFNTEGDVEMPEYGDLPASPFGGLFAPEEEYDQPLTPLDELGLVLENIPNIIPDNLPAEDLSHLTRQKIDLDSPGSLLRDFNQFLDAIGSEGTDLTAANLVPKGRFMAQLNERLTHPIQVAYKRPIPKAYPNIGGLYLLLRVAGLGQIDRKKRLSLDPDILDSWYDLNPTEQYFTLLESWLQRGDSNILGEFSSAYTEPLRQWTSFYPAIPPEGLTVAGDRYWEEHLTFSPGLPYLSLMGMFGFVEIDQGQSPPNQGWRIEKIRRTPFGDAMLVRLFTYYVDEWEQPLQFEDPFFGHLQPIYQSFFPEWQEYLRLPGSDFDESLHTFKITVRRGIWRRIAAPATTTLDQFAGAILDAFEFDHDHLYAFYLANRFGSTERISHPQLDEPPFTSDVRIGDLPLQKGSEMVFLFDFGDQWEFTVRLEKLDPPDRSLRKPALLEKKGKSPEQYPGWDEM